MNPEEKKLTYPGSPGQPKVVGEPEERPSWLQQHNPFHHADPAAAASAPYPIQPPVAEKKPTPAHKPKKKPAHHAAAHPVHHADPKPKHQAVKITAVEIVPPGGGHLLIRGKVGDKEVAAKFGQHSLDLLPDLEAKREYVARQLLAVAGQDPPYVPPGDAGLIGSVDVAVAP